ncbi:hypothetical protein ACERIM_09705 [Natrinema sp. H-ect1]|uniref:hypothetical protein n=1 Tax=Natrinema sp. H-ect1 TaxID=3242700 RepID=UPI00359CE879
MTDTTATRSLRGSSVVAAAAILVGALVAGYGLLVVPASVLGGGWIVAIGLSLLLSGAFATEWAGDRTDLSPTTRHRLSLGLAALAVCLLLALVAVSGATFTSDTIEVSS